MNPIPFIGMSATPIAVDFDGSTYLVKSGGFNVTSKLFTAAGWFYIENSASLRHVAVQRNGSGTWFGVNIYFLADERMVFETGAGFGSNGFSFVTTSAVTLSAWNHFAFSVDLSDTGKRHVYINGSSVSGTWSKYVNATLDYDSGGGNGTSFYVGTNLSTPFDGGLYQFMYAPGAYVNLSDSATLEKFYNSGVVDYGTDGSAALGSVPPVFLNGRSVGRWPSNRGDAGSFTVGAGALTKFATHP